MKSTVPNAATSSKLKGKPMTKTIGLHWLQQVTKHVPATDEASVHRAQLEAQFGEFMKLYRKVPAEMKVQAEQPQQEKKDENEKDKTEN